MKYFDDSELACPCCGKLHIEKDFAYKLDMARQFAGVPFHVNSGFRCPVHNLKVGGSPTSSHLKGWAADIQAKTDFYRYRIIHGAVLAGITRIGIYKNFLHLDFDPDKSQERIFHGGE